MANVVDKLKVFFGFDEGEPLPESRPSTEETSMFKSFKGTLVSAQSTKRFASGEIKVHEPRVYEDSLSIATNLRENTPVIVNLKYLDTGSGKRLIDFVCGTAYAINGHMMKIGENIFLFTPANVLIVDSEEKTTFEKGVAQDEKEVFFKKVANS